jgi:anti-anti-sigma factor
MKIKVKKDSGIVIITISGKIKGEKTVEKFGKIFEELRCEDDIHHVTLDMRLVDDITSRSIGFMLQFFDYFSKRHGSMEIIDVSEPLYDRFLDIHLDRIFPINRK